MKYEVWSKAKKSKMFVRHTKLVFRGPGVSRFDTIDEAVEFAKEVAEERAGVTLARASPATLPVLCDVGVYEWTGTIPASAAVVTFRTNGRGYSTPENPGYYRVRPRKPRKKKEEEDDKQVDLFGGGR